MNYVIRYIDIPGSFRSLKKIELVDGAIPLRTEFRAKIEDLGDYPEYELPELIWNKEHMWVDDNTVVAHDKDSGMKKYKMYTRIYYLLEDDKSSLDTF